MNKTRTVFVEGAIACELGSTDPDWDRFELEGLEYEKFLQGGFLTSQCGVAPHAGDLVGYPREIKREREAVQMVAEIFDPVMMQVLGVEGTMGFAMAGVIHEKEQDGEVTVIKRCEVRSVALMRLDLVSDKRCVVRVVEAPSP